MSIKGAANASNNSEYINWLKSNGLKRVWVPNDGKSHALDKSIVPSEYLEDESFGQYIENDYLKNILVFHADVEDVKDQCEIEYKIQTHLRKVHEIGYYRNAGGNSWLGKEENDSKRNQELNISSVNFDLISEFLPKYDLQTLKDSLDF